MVNYLVDNIIYDRLSEQSDYDISCFSELGKRESQQDCAYCCEDTHSAYAVVCDGMGGLSDGALASQIAVEAAREQFQMINGIDPSYISEGKSWMVDVMEMADHAICNIVDEKGMRVEAGSTFVSVWIFGQRLYWASVGDSRAYLFRGNEMAQLTTDLNYSFFLDQQFQAGEITADYYQRERASGESLISFLGLGALPFVDRNLEPVVLRQGDTILLCSDGLYRAVDLTRINQLISECADMNQLGQRLQQFVQAFKDPKQDNYTGILIRMKGGI